MSVTTQKALVVEVPSTADDVIELFCTEQSINALTSDLNDLQILRDWYLELDAIVNEAKNKRVKLAQKLKSVITARLKTLKVDSTIELETGTITVTGGSVDKAIDAEKLLALYPEVFADKAIWSTTKTALQRKPQ